MDTLFDYSPPEINCPLKDILPVTIIRADQTSKEKLWNCIIRKYHYLGFRSLVGKQLKYLIYGNQQLIAASGWKVGSLQLKSRDDFIGWDQEQKHQYLEQVIDNTRYLIMPWVRIPNLASHLLSRLIKQVQMDWQNKYNKEVFLCETFVDPRYYQGSCYKAANWIKIGESKGYRKTRKGYEYHGIKKEVYLYVVRADFREKIGCTRRYSTYKSPRKKQREEKIIMMIQKADYHPELIEWEELLPEIEKKIPEELIKFYNTFDAAFRRQEQSSYAQIMLKGLISDIERKNLERIALRYLEPQNVRGLQKFFSYGSWDDEWLKNKYREELSKKISSEEGMITVDSSEMPKKGKKSVGVIKQYCGNLGKLENCQSGVYTGYTSNKGYGLTGARLYLPEQWFSEEYKKKREECQIPEEVSFKTKIEIAIEEIKELESTGLYAGKWVGCDATFGSDKKFRDEMEALGKYYFAGIKENQLFWVSKPKLIKQTYKGRGRYPDNEEKLIPETSPEKAKEIVKKAQLKWEKAVLSEGAKGPITAKVGILRVYECHDKMPGKKLWLFVRKDPDGRTRYYVSNAPANTGKKELIRVCTYRWPIEQCFEDGKKYLGMDHYEHRSWIAWHRHMLFIMLAMLFLLILRITFKKNSHQIHCRK